MKILPWALIGAAAGSAIYFLRGTHRHSYAAGNENIDEAAFKTSGWGTKRRMLGAKHRVTGKLKEGFGRATGNEHLTGEGVVEQVAGAADETVGAAAHAAGETIHDLNQ